MTTDEIIAVVSGFKAGRKVQYQTDQGWQPATPPVWNFCAYTYRLAPEPVPPGDLTWEEARELQEQGVETQYWARANQPPVWVDDGGARVKLLEKALRLHLDFLGSLPEGWLAHTCGNVGLLNDAYIASSVAGMAIRDRSAARKAKP